MSDVPAVWHSVSCVCKGCLKADAELLASGFRIPASVRLFEIEPGE